eukprot:SAG11_NODE_5603_length_1511_cov_0.900142_2_plen_266_part_00
MPKLHSQAQALTRHRIAVVLDEHEDLSESWEDSPKDWKRKFLRRAVNLHPKSGKCYSLPNYYEMKKVTKAGSRGVTNQSNWITQPFCLMLGIQWTETVANLPHFLKDGDTLTRDLSKMKVKRHHCNLMMDIVRLYPSLDLDHVVSTLDQFFRNRLPADADSFELEEHELDMSLLEVALHSNFCHFAGHVFLSIQGFATGLANGRETAEIYLHCLEIDLVRNDAYAWFDSDKVALQFVAEYNSLHETIDTTHSISRNGGECLDVES